MAKQTGSIDLKASKNLGDIATDVAQYFWFSSGGSDNGAHVTQVDKATFQSNPSGGNALITSNGFAVRDGLTELAQFGANAVVVGSNSADQIELGSSFAKFKHSGDTVLNIGMSTDFGVKGNIFSTGTNERAGIDFEANESNHKYASVSMQADNGSSIYTTAPYALMSAFRKDTQAEIDLQVGAGSTTNTGIHISHWTTGEPYVRLRADNGNTFGLLTVNPSDVTASVDIITSDGLLKSTKNGNTVTIGSQNSSWCHIYNSANVPFILNKGLSTTGGDLGTASYKWGNLYLSGNAQIDGTIETKYVDLHASSGGATDYDCRLTTNAGSNTGEGFLHINNNPMKDFITERGTSSSWYYRKWNSGKVEAWRTYNAGSQTPSKWTDYMYYKDLDITIPSGIFSATPNHTVATCNGSDYQFMVFVARATSATNIRVRCVKPNSGGATPVIALYVSNMV